MNVRKLILTAALTTIVATQPLAQEHFGKTVRTDGVPNPTNIKVLEPAELDPAPQDTLQVAAASNVEKEPTLEDLMSRPREPLADVPASVPNPDTRIEESMTIPSRVLHGFSARELERSAALRMAALTGAEDSAELGAGGFGEYEIGAGDEVEFISLDNDLLTRTLTIRYDGYVSLPLIPDLKVGGLTRAEAESEIREAYKSSFPEPQISLSVTQPNSKTYTVLGDVERPGVFPYTRKLTLTQTLTLAGGRARQTFGEGNNQFVSVAGQISKAFVIRNIEGERKVLSYDLRNIDQPGAHAGDSTVYFGDVIYVPKGVNLVYLLGEQTVPRIVEMTDGLTLLQMLALAGGFNESTARMKEVILLRAVDDENTDLHLVNLKDVLQNRAQDIPLMAGDIVYIPRKRSVKLFEFVNRFTGSISPILGLYQQAVDSYFTYDINKETLDLLENSNSSVTVNASPLMQAPRPIQ